MNENKKIKNVIFDFGQVLVHFEPEYMTSFYTENENDLKLVSKELFSREYWDRLDAGTIEDEEVVSKVCEKLPERLHTAARLTYENWYRHLPEIDGMREIISILREKYGIKLYILSNISRTFALHYNEIPIINGFDGYVFSSVCGYIKPQKEIFAHLCGKFSILPEETLFIDDNIKNTAGAQSFGIKAYTFDGDAKKLRSYLEYLL